jgi:hypothetical protein
MRLNSEQRDALWELLSGIKTDEATVAAQVYPPAVIGKAVTPPTIVKRVSPEKIWHWHGKSGPIRKKRKKKRIPMEAIFPRSTAR